MRRHHHLAAASAAILLSSTGFAASKPPPHSAADCAAVRFPVQLSAAGALESFAGQYSDGELILAFRQEGYRVLLRSGDQNRELRNIGPWRFEDGCGNFYQFSLPLTGTGANLEVGVRGAKSRRLRRVMAATN